MGVTLQLKKLVQPPSVATGSRQQVALPKRYDFKLHCKLLDYCNTGSECVDVWFVESKLKPGKHAAASFEAKDLPAMLREGPLPLLPGASGY